MKLKEKMLKKDIKKYINEKLFDIEIDLEKGIVDCYLKSEIDSDNLKRVEDDYNQSYTVLNLISLPELKSRFPYNNFNKIKYKIGYNKALGKNVVIKGFTDVVLQGNWDNVNRLKVESENLRIDDDSRIISNLSINLSATKSIYINSSVFTIKNIGVVYMCCENLNIDSSNLLLQGNNVVIYSQLLNLLNSNVSAQSMYTISDSAVIENSNLDAQSILDIKSSTLNLFETQLASEEIHFLCKRINSDNNSIVANKKIVINDDNCDIISKISSDNIIYNNIQIGNNSHLLEKRKEFLDKLQKVKVKSKNL